MTQRKIRKKEKNGKMHRITKEERLGKEQEGHDIATKIDLEALSHSWSIDNRLH